MRKLTAIAICTALLFLAGLNFSRAQDLSVSKSDSCLIDATLAFNNFQENKAVELCRKAIEFNPKNDAAYYLLAKISIAEQDYLNAEKMLKAASDIDSSNYYYLATLGAIYVQNKDLPSAVRLHESLIKKFPTKEDSYISLMEIYYPRGQVDKVMELADKLEKTIGPNQQSTMIKYRVYCSRRQTDKAMRVLMEADSLTPNHVYESSIGDLYNSQSKDSLALLYYSKALALEPDYLPALYGKMQTLLMIKNFRLFLSYLKIFMGMPHASLELKKSLLQDATKNPLFYDPLKEQMADCILEMTKVNPSDSAAAITGAIYLSKFGNFEKAGKVLDDILKYYPEDPYVRGNMTSFLYSTQNWERLEGFADTSMRLFPSQAIEFFQFKGFAEFNLGKYDQAIQTFLSQEKAVKKLKDTTLLLQIYSLVGDMYHEKNDDKTAFRYYDKALKIDPENAPVLNNYAWYIATARTDALPSKKDLKRALAMAQTAVKKTSGEYHNLDTYAWILFLDGNAEEAKKIMQQAVAYGGNEDSGILTRYSDILTSLEEYDLAVMYYGKALLKAAESGNQAEVDKISARLERVKALQEDASEKALEKK